MVFNIRNLFAYIALLCAVFCATSNAQEKFLMVGNAEIRQDLLKYAQICSKETGIPAAALRQILDWPMPDTRPSKEFFQCVCLNTGYTNKEGHFNIDAFLALKIVRGTKEEITQALNECNKVTLDDPVETAYAMGDCIHKTCAFDIEK